MTDERETPADDELLALLRDSTAASSSKHDAAILAAAQAVADRRRRAARTDRSGGWWRTMLVAVPALVVAALVAVRFEAPPPEETVVRGLTVDVEPADGATLAAPPTSLRWHTVAGAEQYRVQLLDAAAVTLWTSEWQSATEVSLADAPALSTGRHLWTVEVRNGRRTELGPFTFNIESP